MAWLFSPGGPGIEEISCLVWPTCEDAATFSSPLELQRRLIEEERTRHNLEWALIFQGLKVVREDWACRGCVYHMHAHGLIAQSDAHAHYNTCWTQIIIIKYILSIPHTKQRVVAITVSAHEAVQLQVGSRHTSTHPQHSQFQQLAT